MEQKRVVVWLRAQRRLRNGLLYVLNNPTAEASFLEPCRMASPS